jgi:hypothetical protein
MRLLLTDIAIKVLSPEKSTEYFCTAIPNFGIRISPLGIKTFFAVTGSEHKRTKVSLARYPAMSLKEARRAAARLDPKTVIIPSFSDMSQRLYCATYEEWLCRATSPPLELTQNQS